jgi:hypothetical protein
MSLIQGVLPFKLDPHGDLADATAYAGLPLVLEQLRVVLRRADYRELRDVLGYTSSQAVQRHCESLVLLLAAGGTCLDDALTLRADHGLAQLLGFRLSSPTQLKEFLYRYHQAEDGRPLTPADDAQLSQAGHATLRPEGPGLRALDALPQRLVAYLQRHRPCACATLDVDATIIEAHKQTALRAYEGTRGYQPQLAFWAEQGVTVCDEFRDGNVNAEYGIAAFLQRAFAALPAGVTQCRLRGDSALYNEAALTWADDQGIEFAVSADMSEALAQTIARLPESAWRPYTSRRQAAAPRDTDADEGEERAWAEVTFIPGWARNHQRHKATLRYLAIRVRSRQTDLFATSPWRHFAVVTNRSGDGQELLRWHRDKQGTVEACHNVVKHDLGAATLPCGRFGANAAYLRLTLLTHTLLTLLKVAALPAAAQTLRPKALRFRLFNVAGRLVHSGRQVLLRLSQQLPWAELYAAARQTLLQLYRRRARAPA